MTCCAGHQCGPGAGRDHCQDFDLQCCGEGSTIGGEIGGGGKILLVGEEMVRRILGERWVLDENILYAILWFCNSILLKYNNEDI